MEHIAPEDQYAAGGQHQEQKQQLKKSAQKGENEGDANQSPGQHRTGSFTGTTGGQGADLNRERGEKSRALHVASQVGFIRSFLAHSWNRA